MSDKQNIIGVPDGRDILEVVERYVMNIDLDPTRLHSLFSPQFVCDWDAFRIKFNEAYGPYAYDPKIPMYVRDASWLFTKLGVYDVGVIAAALRDGSYNPNLHDIKVVRKKRSLWVRIKGWLDKRRQKEELEAEYDDE